MAQLTLVNGQRDNVFNSMYGGYTGHVNLPPSILLNSNFWDDQKIEETVTERYVRQSISEGPLRKKLDEPLAFGEGLTELTYCEWIMERTKKMYVTANFIRLNALLFLNVWLTLEFLGI